MFSLRNTIPMFFFFFAAALPQYGFAGFVLGFTDTGTAGDFKFVEGTTSSVPVFLVQTGINAQTGINEDRLFTVGLFSAGATVDFSTSNSLRGASLASHWTDTIANFVDVDLATGRVTLEGVVSGLTPVKTSNGSNAILIGQISLIPGSAGSKTDLRMSLDNNLPGINLFINNSVIAPSFANASVTSITAVPEPASIGLCLISVGLVQGRRVIRKMRKRFNGLVKE